MGRGHYPYRIAFIVKSLTELIEKLDCYEYKTSLQEKRYVGFAKIVNGLRANQPWRGITTEEQQQLQSITGNLLSSFQQKQTERESLLEKLCNIYVRGADPSWEMLFKNDIYGRVSLPVYPYRKTRCWPEFND